MQKETVSTAASSRNVDPNRLLYSVMIPGIIMPLSGWMFSVSLPVIRDHFGVEPDAAAWIATSFSLTFMIMMPVYGRLSDSLGKRRLLLWGIALFTLGSIIVVSSNTFGMLLFGRVIKGLGIAGTLPISLALITEVFSPDERGGAMGRFSSVGPITGVVAPLLAGFVVDWGGWRMAFVPPILIAVISMVAVYYLIPSTGRSIDWGFLLQFDWIGVLLLSLAMASLLFYLSSRPITGIDPLQDWRLGLAAAIFTIAFVFYELQQDQPFIRLPILKTRSLLTGSLGAALRMMALSGGVGFLMPLYLADVFDLNATQSGYYLMLNPAAMTIFVRLGGRWSDQYGSRRIIVFGFVIVIGFMFGMTQITAESPTWILLSLLTVFGVGAGLMLASLHRAALNDVAEEDMGGASGLYSMIRFMGSSFGAAIAGILLANYLGQFLNNPLQAYQQVYLWFAGFAVLGLLNALFIPEN
ncbi:MAG: MFS transporter [Chloroflexota bacterium]